MVTVDLCFRMIQLMMMVMTMKTFFVVIAIIYFKIMIVMIMKGLSLNWGLFHFFF